MPSITENHEPKHFRNRAVFVHCDDASGMEEPATGSNFYDASVNENYLRKSELITLNFRFHWILFVVTGLGWCVDNTFSQGITAIRPAVANEFTDVGRLSFSSIAYYVGLIIGAWFWGTGVDFIGRKPAFNVTLFYGAIFACASAASPNFLTFCCLWAVIGTAAGGNVPVDSIVFLEFMPQSHQWLLVTLSGWWNFGQVIVSLVAWVFLANFACPSTQAQCPRIDNMGWRYVMITLGSLALAFGIIRIWVFKIPESPKYLISKGRDAEAVEAVNYIARYNGKQETLTIEMLQEIDRLTTNEGLAETSGNNQAMTISSSIVPSRGKLSYRDIIKESFKDYQARNYRSLFSGRKMAQHSAVTFIIWLTIGIAYPLFFAFITSYIEAHSSYSADTSFNHTYMVYCIVSAVGVIGPITAGFAVESRFGRRYMMAGSAVLTGVFLFTYTTVKSEAANIGFQCATAILGNFEYAVMFAFAPESFPGPIRGTGTGIAATLLRLGGLAASFISTYVGYTVVPIYVSAALWVVVGLLCLALPYETHGKASM
ncbi:unnamed protein product [Clonostachys byssicola]|uniref:Major facilitator superfamily (MFS) profile domain-containing protein n=1 Tax=Clonostachys byssicola TaxID=160290 RepID=A0A9N9UBF4_9HYPO|nr:unnamed protein product [Clonostachys byssicola]